MSYSDATIWAVILALGAGTFLMRYSFLGLLAGRQLPEWLLRHLRYTAVGILPALAAPAAIWPTATGGHFDLPRAAAAVAVVAAGVASRNTFVAMLAGAATLYGLLFALA